MPTNGRIISYFEMTIKSSGKKGRHTIGLTPEGYLLTRQAGCEERSFGYHSVNGRKYCYGYNNEGKAYGPTFTVGDVVGCGINFSQDEVFFTKNGKNLGTAFSKVNCSGTGLLYPTISLHSPGEKVSVNFGNRPFKFDLESFIEASYSFHTLSSLFLGF